MACRSREVFCSRLFLVLGLILWSVVCSQQALASERLTVFAAASLKNVLDSIAVSWTTKTGEQIVNVYGASSALAKQIEAGAPADVYVSADQDWMGYLAERNLVRADSIARLLGNVLVLVAPADSVETTTIVPGFDLSGFLDGGWLAMAEVNSVPAGRYGKQALENLQVWDSVKSRVAQAENVRAALMLVAAGEAAAGIVYQTDALAEPRVRVIGIFPDNSHSPIIYPVAVIRSSKNPKSMEFANYLQSTEARLIFEANGFRVLAEQ